MIILCYHDLSATPTNPWTLHPDTFRSHLDILSSRGYHTSTLDEMTASTESRQDVVILSFDDGREGCIRFAIDLLGSYGMTAVFYICTGFLDGADMPSRERYSRFINWHDVRYLQNCGHLIGSHAVTHRSFRELSITERRQELLFSKSRIENETGRSCEHFAAPYGYLDRETSMLATEAGYKTSVSTKSGVNHSPFELSCLRRWQVCPPCDVKSFEEALDQLDQRHSEIRVLRLHKGPFAETGNDKIFELIGDYDVVITDDAAMENTLKALNVAYANSDAIQIDIQQTNAVEERNKLETAIRTAYKIAPESKVIIDTL